MYRQVRPVRRSATRMSSSASQDSNTCARIQGSTRWNTGPGGLAPLQLTGGSGQRSGGVPIPAQSARGLLLDGDFFGVVRSVWVLVVSRNTRSPSRSEQIGVELTLSAVGR
jgi:hypothetical protein